MNLDFFFFLYFSGVGCRVVDLVYTKIAQSVRISSVQSLRHFRLFVTPRSVHVGFPDHHQNLELIQTHVHQVSDAIQPSHPLSFPSPPTVSFPASGSFPMSQFFESGGQSFIGVAPSASVLPMNIQD